MKAVYRLGKIMGDYDFKFCDALLNFGDPCASPTQSKTEARQLITKKKVVKY